MTNPLINPNWEHLLNDGKCIASHTNSSPIERVFEHFRAAYHPARHCGQGEHRSSYTARHQAGNRPASANAPTG